MREDRGERRMEKMKVEGKGVRENRGKRRRDRDAEKEGIEGVRNGRG